MVEYIGGRDLGKVLLLGKVLVEYISGRVYSGGTDFEKGAAFLGNVVVVEI